MSNAKREISVSTVNKIVRPDENNQEKVIKSASDTITDKNVK